ncbi:hypothetical protein ACYATM_03955 [Lactobacillaceae bacterium Scapto_B20]
MYEISVQTIELITNRVVDGKTVDWLSQLMVTSNGELKSAIEFNRAFVDQLALVNQTINGRSTHHSLGRRFIGFDDLKEVFKNESTGQVSIIYRTNIRMLTQQLIDQVAKLNVIQEPKVLSRTDLKALAAEFQFVMDAGIYDHIDDLTDPDKIIISEYPLNIFTNDDEDNFDDIW